MTARGDSAHPGPRWSRRGVTAVVAVVLGAMVAVVVPALLWDTGWHRAESGRGVGGNRGVFTVASCGDRQEQDVTTDVGTTTTVTYTCTGTFDGRSGTRIDASVISGQNYRPGTRKRAYASGDGGVHLSSRAEAAVGMASWFTAAFAVACLEVPAVWRLYRWIRGRVPIGLGETRFWWLDLPFSVPFGLWLTPLVFVLACVLFVILFVALG